MIKLEGKTQQAEKEIPEEGLNTKSYTFFESVSRSTLFQNYAFQRLPSI
jgi:hypothetical protein